MESVLALNTSICTFVFFGVPLTKKETVLLEEEIKEKRPPDIVFSSSYFKGTFGVTSLLLACFPGMIHAGGEGDGWRMGVVVKHFYQELQLCT